MNYWKEKIKVFMKHPLFLGGFLMIGGSMGVNFINYIYHLLMGRFLGPTDYGILSSLYSVIYLVGIVPISTSVAIVKFISSAKNKDEAYAIFFTLKSFVFKLALTVCSILILVTPFIARFLNISNNLVVFLIPIILFFLLIALVNQATSQGLLKFAGNVIPSLISSVVKLTLGLILVFLGFSVFGAMFGLVVASICSYLYSHFYLKKYIKSRKDRIYNLKPFLKYSLPVLAQALAFTSLFTVDVILVKHFLSPFNAGIYAAISTLGKIIYFAASPIVSTMFPIISGRSSRGQSFRKVLWVSIGATVIISGAIVTVYWLFPDIIISMLYGTDYIIAKQELVWMGLFIFFYTISYLFVNFLLSLGKVKVIIFPLIAAFLQFTLIWYFHNDLLQVVQISMVVAATLFLVLSLYLGYNKLIKNHD